MNLQHKQFLKIKGKKPKKGSVGSAGYDLQSIEQVVLKKAERKLINTGISICMPIGIYGRIASRSGLSIKHGIEVGAGVIDSDYTGIIKVLLYNLGTEEFLVQRGDRIAQLIFETYINPLFEVVDELPRKILNYVIIFEKHKDNTNISEKKICNAITLFNKITRAYLLYSSLMSINDENLVDNTTFLAVLSKANVSYESKENKEMESKSELVKGHESISAARVAPNNALGCISIAYASPLSINYIPPSQPLSASNALANSSASLVSALQTPLVPAKSTTRSADYAKKREYKSNAVKGLYDYWVGLFIQIFNSFSMLSLQIEKNQQQTIETILKTAEATVKEVKSSTAATIEAVNISANENIKNARKESDRVIAAQNKQLAILKSRLAEQNEEISKQHDILDFLQKEELARKFAQERAKQRAERRKMRERKPVRDAASAPELYAFLEAVFNYEYRSEFARSRDVVAGLVLYVTGFRVGNLLDFQVKDLDILLNPKESERVLHVALIKGVEEKQPIPISDIYYEMYKEYASDFRALQKEKDTNDAVFTAEGEIRAIERSWLTKRLNKHLDVAGKKLNKKLSTHSWRIGHMSALLDAVGIEQAMHLAGHKNIQTTQVYSRQKRNKRETLQVLARAAKAKVKRDAC